MIIFVKAVTFLHKNGFISAKNGLFLPKMVRFSIYLKRPLESSEQALSAVKTIVDVLIRAGAVIRDNTVGLGCSVL